MRVEKRTYEELPEVLFLVNALQEHVLVRVLESEVERLRWEVADDVGEITAPQRPEALLFGHAYEAIDDALVSHLGRDML